MKAVWNDDCYEERLFGCGRVRQLLELEAAHPWMCSWLALQTKERERSTSLHVCTSFSGPKKILFDPSTKDVDAL